MYLLFLFSDLRYNKGIKGYIPDFMAAYSSLKELFVQETGILKPYPFGFDPSTKIDGEIAASIDLDGLKGQMIIVPNLEDQILTVDEIDRSSREELFRFCSDWECSVCLNGGQVKYFRSECGHKFDVICLTKWARRCKFLEGILVTCPNCRRPLEKEY